jgi:hypothetical protein
MNKLMEKDAFTPSPLHVPLSPLSPDAWWRHDPFKPFLFVPFCPSSSLSMRLNASYQAASNNGLYEKQTGSDVP